MQSVEAPYGLGQCFAHTPHLAYLTDGLGTHPEILANTCKPFFEGVTAPLAVLYVRRRG
jgi:hypothetical protein